MEDAYWQTILAGHNPETDPRLDNQTVKAHFQAWKRQSRKHAYLRRIPSPVFEHALAFTIVLSLCCDLIKYFLRLATGQAQFKSLGFTLRTGNRRLIRTEKGYIGLAGMMVRKGDVIVLCKGGKLPLVVRRENRDCFKLMSDCYVHGVMGGEAFREHDCEEIWLC